MVVWSSRTAARVAAASLRKANKSNKNLEEACDQLRNVKEILCYVDLDNNEFAELRFFCHQMLWCTRGLLLGWDIDATPCVFFNGNGMPCSWRLEKKHTRQITHPDLEIFLKEVQSGVTFLEP